MLSDYDKNFLLVTQGSAFLFAIINNIIHGIFTGETSIGNFYGNP